jgi:hypothetical protein
MTTTRRRGGGETRGPHGLSSPFRSWWSAVVVSLLLFLCCGPQVVAAVDKKAFKEDGKGWEMSRSEAALEYRPMIDTVDMSCVWSLRDEVGLGFLFDEGRSRAIARPMTSASTNLASFASSPRLCELNVTKNNHFKGPAVLSVSGDAAYALTWWPMLLNVAKYSQRFALRYVCWFGDLPAPIRKIGSACANSVYGKEQRALNEPVSIHYAKVLGAMALMDREDITGILWLDMDVYVDPVAFTAGAPDAYTAMSREYPSASVVFADGDNKRLWRTKSDVFFARDDAFSWRFMALWLRHRCGFKDQYPLWHVTLKLADQAGCLHGSNSTAKGERGRPYKDDIYKLGYWAVRDLRFPDFRPAQCQRPEKFRFDAAGGHVASLPGAGCKEVKTSFAMTVKPNSNPCKRGLVSHLTDNRHKRNLTYGVDNQGVPQKLLLRVSGRMYDMPKMRDVYAALTLDIDQKPSQLLASKNLGRGCCTAEGSKDPLCDHCHLSPNNIMCGGDDGDHPS